MLFTFLTYLLAAVLFAVLLAAGLGALLLPYYFVVRWRDAKAQAALEAALKG